MPSKEVKLDMARKAIDRLVKDRMQQLRYDGVAVPCEWDVRQHIIRICEKHDRERRRI